MRKMIVCISPLLSILVLFVSRPASLRLEPNPKVIRLWQQSESTKMYTNSPGALCTSFGLEKDGYVIHGFNLEHQSIHKGQVFINPRGMQKQGREKSTTGQIAEWTSIYGSVTFNLVGYQYAEAGMNEAGLTISTMSLKSSQVPAADERPPLDEPLWTQYMLDNFSTVEQVIASDGVVRLVDTNSHFFVCDRKGACAAIELLDGQMVVYTDQDLSLKVMTNTAYQEALRALKGGALSDGSLRRFGIVSGRVQRFDPQRDADAVDFAFQTLTLAAASEVGTPPAQWSMVFDPYNFVIYYRTRLNPQVRVLDFDDLDFACKGHSSMSDIHAGDAGDISGEFSPYDHATVLQHFVQFFDAWGMDVSPESAEALVAKLENFTCSPRTSLAADPPEPSTVNSETRDQFASQVAPWWVVLGIPVIALLSLVIKTEALRSAWNSRFCRW